MSSCRKVEIISFNHDSLSYDVKKSQRDTYFGKNTEV